MWARERSEPACHAGPVPGALTPSPSSPHPPPPSHYSPGIELSIGCNLKDLDSVHAVSWHWGPSRVGCDGTAERWGLRPVPTHPLATDPIVRIQMIN